MNCNDSEPGNVSRRRLETAVRTIIKTGVTAATIAALAFGVAIFGGDGEVSESHADIFDLGFGGPEPDQQQFQDSLQNLGHDEPQQFELNGNIVHFSVDYTREAPDDVAERYQREFVRNNINDRVYDSLDPDEDLDVMTARLTGQIAPVRYQPDKITMGGMITRNRAADEDALLELGGQLHLDDEVFRAHRWIEIFEEPGSDQTTVLASWSDDDFSFDRMIPGNESRTGADRRRGTDTEVPACPGCTRVHQFDDLDERRGYTTNIFVSRATPDEMLRFYREAMVRRGWQISEFQESHDSLRQAVDFGDDRRDVLYFERDDEQLEVFTYPVEDGDIAVQTALWEESNDRSR